MKLLSDLIGIGRAALWRLDRPALEQVTARLVRLPPATDAETEVGGGLLRAFGAFLCGAPAPAGLDQLAARAAAARLAAAVVEIRALRALFAIEAGDLVAGLAHARRASLMARTEGILDAELLANLALVRARRYNRQPHLALRILDALEGIAAPHWRPWLQWERSLAGGALVTTPAGAVAGLPGLLAAAQAGDRATFQRHGEALRGAEVAEPLRREADILIAALDPTAPVWPTAPGAELLAWRAGQAALPPASLHGLAVQSAASVMLCPSGARARCLHLGLPLLGGQDLVHLRQSRLTHGRVETLLAVLALAGPDGLDEATCFARAYGFTYVPTLHRGVFDVLVHRARSAVEGIATIARTPGKVAIVTTRLLLVPDPRTSRSTTDRVLRLLAERGRASAKEAAARLGVSVRTVQSALSDLAASHACVVERDGRNVTYVVEDSVFSEPTRRLANLRQELAAGG